MRKVSVDDASFGLQLYGDPRVNKYLAGAGASTLEEERAALARHIERTWDAYDHGLMTVFRKDTGTFVGMCGLLHWDLDGAEETEVSYALIPEAWGFGFATEAAQALAQDAFERLGRTRVISLVHPDNIASQRVALKSGMILERSTSLRDTPANVYARTR